MELQARPSGGNVTALDRYLSQVGRHLVGLPAKLREDVLLELRSNILAQAQDEGAALGELVEKMGPPKATARSFLQLYGYGTGIKLLASLAASALAFLTVPFAPVSSAILGTAWLANASLLVLILLLVLVGVRMGRKAALPAGFAAAGARFVALGIGLSNAVPELATEPVAILVFTLTTVALAFAGTLAAPRAPPPAEP